jgi:hypothetical protein
MQKNGSDFLNKKSSTRRSHTGERMLWSQKTYGAYNLKQNEILLLKKLHKHDNYDNI